MLWMFQGGRAGPNELCLNGKSILDKFCTCGGRFYVCGATFCSQVFWPRLFCSVRWIYLASKKPALSLFFLTDCISLVSFARQALNVSISWAVYMRQTHEEQEGDRRMWRCIPRIAHPGWCRVRYPALPGFPLLLVALPPTPWALLQDCAIPTTKC